MFSLGLLAFLECMSSPSGALAVLAFPLDFAPASLLAWTDLAPLAAKKNRDFVDFRGFLSIPTLQKSRKITILLTVINVLQKH